MLGKVAGLAAKYCAPGQDAIRLTNKQNLLILNVPRKISLTSKRKWTTSRSTTPVEFPAGLRELHRHRILQSRRRRNKEPDDSRSSKNSKRRAAGIAEKSASISAAARVPAASIKSPTSVSAARKTKLRAASRSMPTIASSADASAIAAASTNSSKQNHGSQSARLHRQNPPRLRRAKTRRGDIR